LIKLFCWSFLFWENVFILNIKNKERISTIKKIEGGGSVFFFEKFGPEKYKKLMKFFFKLEKIRVWNFP